MLDDAGVSYFLASRAIRRGNKGTTVMTIVILSIVFINMLFLPSIFEGFMQHFIEKNIDYYSGHMVIYPRENERYIENATEVAQKIAGIPGVVGTTRRESVPVIITYRDRVVSKNILGIDPPNEKTVTKLHTGMKDGEFLDEGDTDAIILGAFLAGDKNKKEEEEFFYSLRGIGTGEGVQVTYNNGVTKNYQVKGILQTKDQNIDYNAYVNLKELEAVTATPDQATSVNIRLSPSVPVNDFKYTLMKFGIQQKIRTWLEDAAAARDYMRSFDIINFISGIASLIIAIIIMFVVVYINTINKRKQIAILKAIGIEKKIIINSYVFQVIFYTVCGILLGVILILGLVGYLTAHPMEFPDGNVSPVINWMSMVQAAVTLFIASLISGYIPAWNTVKQEILEAMRG
jgi:putative ABC transport system permease protein